MHASDLFKSGSSSPIPAAIVASRFLQLRTASYPRTIVVFLIAFCIAAVAAHAQSTASHATINFTHDDNNYAVNGGDSGWLYNSGTVYLTINGTETEQAPWWAGQAGNYADFIANLAAAINSNSTLVSAQVAADDYFDGSGTIVLTSKATGPTTNYSLSLTVTYDTNDLCADQFGNLVTCFSGPFPVGSAPANMAGGQTIVTAYINPKYRIIGVEYAPPGTASSVSYTGNTTVGHTTDISSSFSSNVSETVSIGSTGGIFGFFKGGVTGTSTTSWTQGSSSDNTTTLTQSSSFTNALNGPTNSFAGIDHDFDEILLWLNPVVPLSQPFPIISPIEPVTWDGYGFDLSDTTAPNDLDIQHIKVGWLNGDISIPSDIASVLDRAWAGGSEFNWPSGQGPGLTGPGTDPNSDFGQILQADPFAWCTPISNGVVPQVPTGPGTTGPATCPSSVPIEPNSNRYTQVTQQPLNYTQAAVGTTPSPNTFNQSTTTMTSNQTGSSHDFTQGFAIDITFTAGSKELEGLTYDFKTSNSETWSDKTLKTLSNTTGNTATVTITGPACTVVNNVCSPQYTGPNLLTLYQDNLYGTFMFLAGSSPNYILNVQPSPVAVPVGGTASYSVTATAIDNYNGNIALSLATTPALPTGAQATFTPTTITPGQTSTLTITTNATTTPPGSTTFQINASGASGTGGPPLVNNTTATLVVQDFELAVTPTSNTVNGGQSAEYQVTVTPLPFSSSPGLDVSAFTVAATSLPPFTTQVQGPNSPTGVDNGFTTTLTINTDVGGITPGGTAHLLLQATVATISPTISHTQNVDLTDNAPDFTLTASPGSQTIVPGASATYQVSSTPVNGFNGTINLVGVSLPTGVSVSCNPSSIGPSGTSQCTVSAASTVSPSTYSIHIQGTSSTIVHIPAVTLVVVPDFTLSATPSSQFVAPGASTTYTVSTGSSNGFTGHVTLSVTGGLPSGASAAFSPNPITGVGNSTMTVTTTTSVALGTYTLTIKGSSDNGAPDKFTTVTLIVAVPDFTISATPSSQMIAPGASTTYTVTITGVNGFTDSVTLAVSGLPRGATATFSPNPVTGGSGNSTMTVNTTTAVGVGNYPLTITGTSGSGTISHSTTVTLIVAIPNFTISATPSSQTVAPGASTSYTVSITSQGGFSGDVSLAASGMPRGVSVSFSPNPVTGGSGNSTMSVTTTTAVGAGSYILTITGTSGTLNPTTTVTLVVSTAPSTIVVDFDNPAPTDPSGTLNGLFGGIDFGTNQWLWEGAYLADGTNNIFFNSSTGNSRTFTFASGSHVLISMKIVTPIAGTLTLTDDTGQTFTQSISTGPEQLVTTGWTNRSTTITLNFTAGWNMAIDDITYSNP